jgi:Spy/CpxP family protein refolding chaperone
MTTRRAIILSALALVVAAGAFAITRAATATSGPAAVQPTDALLDWLSVPPSQREQIRQHDPTFEADLATLRQNLSAARMALAAALEDSSSPDELITGRVEAVIAASNALERRVLRYVLSVREHLTAEQQQQLFALCAQGVRQGGGWRWGQQQGGVGAGRGGGRGFGPGGGGFGPGGGGPGGGTGWRGGR